MPDRSLKSTAPGGGEQSDKPLALALMGPTASGKTNIAMGLADQYPVSIISVDSSLVYKGMDIGAAKPDKEMLRRYPHYLVDIREPNEPYSAANFREDALEVIEKVIAQGRIPLLVGGTMLYFKVLLDGMAELPAANEKVRQEIVEKARKLGWKAIHEELKEIDPISAARIHPNDIQRLQRAIEVFELSGQTLTELQSAQSEQVLPCRMVSMALMTENRALLHSRIAQRFEQMLSSGFVDEVRALKAKYPSERDLPSMRAVGYRQMWQYLAGELNYEEMAEKGLAATRQLAKRQITWLRAWPELHCFDMEDPDLLTLVTKKVDELLEIDD